MTISMHRLKHNFNRAAADYDTHAAFQATQTRRLFHFARGVLSPDANILDLGCGTGQFARIAAESCVDWRITGIDIAEEMCRTAHAHTSSIVTADAIQLPFAAASFDAVVSSLCMQWVEDKPRAFAEIQRVLKPGGIGIILALAEETLKELQHVVATLAIPIALLEMTSVAAYGDAAKQAGFDLVKIQSESEIQHYSSAATLLHSMKSIGAGNANTKQRNQPIAPSAMKKLLAAYASDYRDKNGVFATWQPILLHLRKPS